MSHLILAAVLTTPTAEAQSESQAILAARISIGDLRAKVEGLETRSAGDGFEHFFRLRPKGRPAVFFRIETRVRPSGRISIEAGEGWKVASAISQKT